MRCPDVDIFPTRSAARTAMMIDMRHLLIVDDDEQLRSLLLRFFRLHGFEVTDADGGAAMFAAIERTVFDLIILDVMMPDGDGFTLLPKLREQRKLPVIMLTAMGEETDRVVGLELGADDYMVKPFSPRELLARVKAVLRRTGEQDSMATDRQPRIGFAGWSLDIAARELRSPTGVLVPLSGGEYELLMAFLEHPNRVLTRDQLLDFARGPGSSAFDRSIDVQVSRLRRKLEADPREPALVKTIRSGGYMFSAKVTRG